MLAEQAREIIHPATAAGGFITILQRSESEFED